MSKRVEGVESAAAYPCLPDPLETGGDMMADMFGSSQEPLAGCGEEPPPAFSHPLVEGDKLQEPGHMLSSKVSKLPECSAPLTNNLPESPGPSIPLTEGGVEDRGRLPGEATEPLPLHRKLYNPNLQPSANALRKRMTKAEACLWKCVLRAGQMKGYTFNRQRPVLRYVADFMCKALNLIIEVDGSIHNDPDIQRHDKFRQSELEACGFAILRFTNAEVLHAIGSVRTSIERKIVELQSSIRVDGRKRI